MKRCTYCNEDVKMVKSCSNNKGGRKIHFFDGDVTAIPWSGKGECPECHVPRGEFHHPGCDEEDCPKCKNKLTKCQCLAERRPVDDLFDDGFLERVDWWRR